MHLDTEAVHVAIQLLLEGPHIACPHSLCMTTMCPEQVMTAGALKGGGDPEGGVPMVCALLGSTHLLPQFTYIVVKTEV